MRFEVGDTVAVLDDVVKGVVTEIRGEQILVKSADGMIFSYAPSDLVKIGVDQNELSKYSDIDNQLLKEKLLENPKGASKFVTSKKEITLEVDLHINQLVKSTKGMDNFDMLNLQMDTARRKLEYAIQKKIPKIVFIHGVGAGVLKMELQYLFQKYPVKFYDASYQKYGLGATEVYIFQNPN
ncbi:MAG: DNA mismatch repair protein MutS [Polaribacter sp.]|nr:DNA mismatch repair protein MutS [Polaribacter sp.]